MNKQLHAMGFETMISVWPRFVPEDRYYAELRQNGWLIHLADGTPIDGLPYDRAGSDIDTTNPDAAAVVLEDDPRQHSEQGLRLASGPTRPSPTCLPTALLPRRSRARSSSTSTRSSTPAALYDGFRKDEPGGGR
jgi:hypothetical protein